MASIFLAPELHPLDPEHRPQNLKRRVDFVRAQDDGFFALLFSPSYVNVGSVGKGNYLSSSVATSLFLKQCCSPCYLYEDVD